MSLLGNVFKIGGTALGAAFGQPQLGALLGGAAGSMFGGNTTKREEDEDMFSTENATRSPILSQDWTNAFNAAKGNLNSGGFTTGQQGALDWLGNRVGNNPILSGVNAANGNIDASMGSLNNLTSGYNWMAGQAAPQLGAAPTSDYAGDVTARTGASFRDAYANPFNSEVIDSTINDYNTNVDRTLSGLRQGRDAAGAFGDRGQVAEGQFLGDANRGLLSTVSNLRANNFQNSSLLGMQDANRFLSADQGNQNTRQQNNQFNSGLLDSRERANIGYKQNQDDNVFRAAEGIRANIAQQTGLSQQQLANLVTADGVDTAAVEAAFNAGGISQSQRLALLEAANQANGSNVSGTRNSTNSRTGSSTSPYMWGSDQDGNDLLGKELSKLWG